MTAVCDVLRREFSFQPLGKCKLQKGIFQSAFTLTKKVTALNLKTLFESNKLFFIKYTSTINKNKFSQILQPTPNITDFLRRL